MNYRTDLMNKILTNEKAQEIIDYVSQIYGDSYVGLWIYQAIGTVLGEVDEIANQLMDETSPVTTTLLLTYWEQAYGIEPDPTMTLEQRRARIIGAIGSKGACTPARLAAAISAALGSVPVEIYENTGKNEFTVNIRAAVRVMAPALAVIEAMKPAHLVYKIQGITKETADTNINVGIAMTRAEMNTIKPTNAVAAVHTPTIVDGELMIRHVAAVNGSTSMEKTQHTYSNGAVTLTTIKATSDGNGTVTLNSYIDTEEGN